MMPLTAKPNPTGAPATASLDQGEPGLRKLVFVHLSDLHFSSRPRDSKWELDQTLRSELRHDLRAQIRDRGGATAILVSGDIAFSGASTEYAKAREFFVQLCVELNIPTEDVWVIPGNHDVDWGRHKEQDTASVRATLMGTAEHKLDSVLEQLMRAPAAAHALLKPLSNYFDFAADFGCQPDVSDLAWDATFARLVIILGGSRDDWSGVQLAHDEVDHRDEVAVGAVSASAALGGLDQ